MYLLRQEPHEYHLEQWSVATGPTDYTIVKKKIASIVGSITLLVKNATLKLLFGTFI